MLNPPLAAINVFHWRRRTCGETSADILGFHHMTEHGNRGWGVGGLGAGRQFFSTAAHPRLCQHSFTVLINIPALRRRETAAVKQPPPSPPPPPSLPPSSIHPHVPVPLGPPPSPLISASL
ncbi:unnamed protein product [Pleuronectes platessa]|uniref:Uncharacterized protein n=1 Tax=Pleuronectes platessa TaxID=8262 RepID=A0A9N7YE19_PLEPL|nr:unnamed protein product [Pleuronectes platessa]